jgi:hypothetical protein
MVKQEHIMSQQEERLKKKMLQKIEEAGGELL